MFLRVVHMNCSCGQASQVCLFAFRRSSARSLRRCLVVSAHIADCLDHATILTWRKKNNHNNDNHTTTTTQQQPQQQRHLKNNLGRLRLNRRGASTPLWRVEACSLPSRWPNPIQAIPPFVVKTPHLHGAPTTEETSFVKPPIQRLEAAYT